MIQFDSWWFPDGETNLPDAMTSVNHREYDYLGVHRLTYQYQKYEICRNVLPHSRRRVALDIGAHIGLWAYWMGRDFARVIAFEPSVAHLACLRRNVTDAEGYRDNVAIHPCALGRTCGWQGMQHPAGASGGSYLTSDTADTNGHSNLEIVEVHRLDDYLGLIPVCDFVKIDVEGYELPVVEGGAAFFHFRRPLIILETIPDNAGRYGRSAMDAVAMLEELGAHVVVRLGHHDLVMDWAEKPDPLVSGS